MITTLAPTGALASPSGYSGLLYVAWLPFLGATLVRVNSRSQQIKRRKSLGLVTCGVLLTGMVFQAACGGGTGRNGGGSGGTPKGNYTITVMGTSGSLSHSTTVTLVVQ